MKSSKFLFVFLCMVILLCSICLFSIIQVKKTQKLSTYAIYSICTDEPVPANVGIGTALNPFYIAMTYHQLQGIGNRDFIAKNYYASESFLLKKVAIFPELDLVILKSDARLPFYYNIGPVVDCNFGDPLYAVGSNLLISDGSIITQGSFVSLVTNEISSNPPILTSMIVCDARSNSGFSGGALLSQQGRCIGIICGRLFLETGEESLALYAIRSDYISRVLNNKNIKTYFFASLDFAIVKRFNPLTKGYTAIVKRDFNDFLKKGDEIVSIDDLNFYTESDVFYLLSTVSNLVRFSILRDGKLIKFEVSVLYAN